MKRLAAAFVASLNEPAPGWLVSFGAFLITLVVGVWWFVLISGSLWSW